MDVHGRISRFASQLTELLAELLLEIVGELILSTEEDYATLGHYRLLASLFKQRYADDMD